MPGFSFFFSFALSSFSVQPYNYLLLYENKWKLDRCLKAVLFQTELDQTHHCCVARDQNLSAVTCLSLK